MKNGIFSIGIKGELLVFLSAMGFATMGVLGKMAYSYGLNTTTLLFLRFFIAAIILFLVSHILKRPLMLKIKDGLIAFGFGFIGYNLVSFCYFYSLNFIPASLTAVIFFTYPIFVTLFSFVFFKEKLTPNKILSLVLGSVGILSIVSPGKAQIDYRGIIFSLLGGILYAFYVLGLSLPRVKKIDSVKMSFYTNIFAALGMGIAAIVSNTFIYPINIFALSYAALIGIFATSVAMLALFAGVKRIGAVKGSIIANMEIVIACILGAVFLNEKMGIYQLMGAVLIITSAIMVSLPSKALKKVSLENSFEVK